MSNLLGRITTTIMGNCSGTASSGKSTHVLYIKTGDKKGAGTNGNIFVTLIDENKHSCDEQTLDTTWKNDFEQGSTDEFHMHLPNLGKVSELRIRRDKTGENDSWYVEKVAVQHNALSSAQTVFPIHRWIQASSEFTVREFDCSLPQDDPHAAQRVKELELKRILFKLKAQMDGLPKQVEVMPQDESFSNDYQWDILSRKVKLLAETKLMNFITATFDELSDFEAVYKTKDLPPPYGIVNWKSDAEFGNQRLAGCNPTLLALCQKIPDHFSVTPELVQPFLEGFTLADAMQRKKIYIVDLRFLAKVECTNGRKVCGPTALFYSQKAGDLVPIAIQLQPTPSADNPVFLPSDPEYTWLMAKMWYNNADCSYHQSVTHLGFTHLIMESVAVCTHRQLSPSHPVFKLLAPHFLFLLAINTNALNKLVSDGGWVDKTMTIGRIGMFNIIKESWRKWNLKEYGNIIGDFKKRGVDDKEALPNYHYRDDATLLWDAINKYISAVINAIYTSPDKLQKDNEIHAWGKELSDPKDGAHVEGVPAHFATNDQLIEVLTVFVFISSVGHAAANFCQYDEYAFPPNYPAMLHGVPPTSKAPLTEKDIVRSLPPKETVFSIMVVTRILSERGTNNLGDFEMQYAYDPIAMTALQQFRADLKVIAETIDKRNTARVRKYPYLNPREVPNAISI